MQNPASAIKPMVDLLGASFYGAPTSGGGQFPTAALDDPVAQSVEHVTFNHVAVGSNPTRITILSNLDQAKTATFRGP